MKIRIRVETEFGWGETRSHDLGTVERDSIGASDEDFGLSLAEGKSLLTEIQRVLLQDQVEEISEEVEEIDVKLERLSHKLICKLDEINERLDRLEGKQE